MPKVSYLLLTCTPVIIKFPFWQMTAANPLATFACVNFGEAAAPRQITGRSILLDADIDQVVADLLERL